MTVLPRRDGAEGLVGEVAVPKGRSENPIRTSTSMKQRHFMDKNPILTSTSMKQRHFMDENLIRTSTLLEAHFFLSRDFERLRG